MNLQQKKLKMCDISDGIIAESDIVKIIGEHGRDSVPYISEYVKSIKESMANN